MMLADCDEVIVDEPSMARPVPSSTQLSYVGSKPYSLHSSGGLEMLANLDYVVVRQKIEVAEICCGCEFANHYDVVTP